MYSKKIQDVLKKKKIKIRDRISIKKGNNTYEGILMPRIELGDHDCLVIKLDNGYNIGLKSTEITKISGAKIKTKKTSKKIKHDSKKPTILIMSTGGTIASKIDYETGGVSPVFTAEDLVESVPELGKIANIKAKLIESVLSEDMDFSHYRRIIREIEKALKERYVGIIITHGTDTLHYTASALSFALENLSIPIILVGSQRSSDRASSDGPFNLICATRFIAESDFGEVGICMHGTESDDYCLINPACKTRKMHTSRRDAFLSVNTKPWASVTPKGDIKFFRRDYKKKDKKSPKIMDKFEEKVALVKFYPGMKPDIIDLLKKKKYKGLVLEGTGLGHCSKKLISSMKEFSKKGVIIMTSQCINGRVNMNIYSTGRLLRKIGVIPGEDMLPEVAYIKLAWLLGNYKDLQKIKDLVRKNLRGEINDRSEL